VVMEAYGTREVSFALNCSVGIGERVAVLAWDMSENSSPASNTVVLK